MIPEQSQLFANGWDGLNVSGDPVKDDIAETKSRELAQAFERVFTTDDGKVVLDHILSRTLRARMTPKTVEAQHPVSFDDIAPFVTYREGQNSIAALIVNMISKAR